MDKTIFTYIDDLGTEESDGFSRKNADGTYTIILNARCSCEKQAEIYQHELKHIHSGHLDDVVDVQKAEIAVRNNSPRMIKGMPLDQWIAQCHEAGQKKIRELKAKQKRKTVPSWFVELERQMGKE